MRLLRKRDVLACLSPEAVLEAVRESLIAAARGLVTMPAPLSFPFPDHRGEAHIKGAHIAGAPDWTVKLATGFYDNPALGLPSASGLSLVASAETGLLQAIVLDGGHLTDVRTAAAGAIAVDALASADVEEVAIIGAGIQAEVQLEYLLLVRSPSHVRVFGRSRDRAQAYADLASERFGLEVAVATDVRTAVEGAQVVLTVTPAQEPLVEASWLGSPVAVVAVGSDTAGKQELDPEILRRADVLVADDPAQAARVGELQHVPECLDAARPIGELLAERRGPGDQVGLAVADLTGLGVQDAAVAGLVARRAEELGLGEPLELD